VWLHIHDLCPENHRKIDPSDTFSACCEIVYTGDTKTIPVHRGEEEATSLLSSLDRLIILDRS